MPLTEDQVKELETTRSHYGCGASACRACYPIQYACEYCHETFEQPIANGERYTCVTCDWENNGDEL